MNPIATTSADELFDRLFNTEEGRRDPYPIYRRLHGTAPFHRNLKDDIWYASRHDTCQQVLLDPRLGHDQDRLFERPGGMSEEQRRMFEERLEKRRRRGFSMLTENPPDHTRMRRLVSKAFTFRRVESMRPRIAELTAGYLARMAREADVMEHLAFPLPVTVIGEMVGVPEEHRGRFRPLVQEGLLASDKPEPTKEEIRRSEAAFDEMEGIFLALIEERRARPRDDMLSVLIAVRDDEAGGRLTEDELISTAFLLFLAGFVTTTNLIGNGLVALFEHPDQLDALWRNGSLVPSAVEEMLRYDSPVQLVSRDVLAEVEVEGRVFHRGEKIIPLLGAANRDPRRFEDPDRFDVARRDNHPLSFGWGIHHCLGAALARAEGQIVFGLLRENFSKLEWLDLQAPLAGGFLRGRRSVHIRFTRR
ncbi:MAG: cytochrome P450 [Actinomycetota bacterium]